MRIRLVPKVKKSSIQVVAIVLLSCLSGLAVFTYTSGVENRVRSTQQTTNVYLTTKQIPIGTGLGSAINQGYLELKKFPLESVPSGAISLIDSRNSELVALQTLQPGQILIQSNFGVTAANTGALVIPDGLLAITVSLSDPARVASFLEPGSEISIFVTGQSGNSKFTQVLIQRTQVLAVGNQVLPNPAGAAGTNTSALITVAVSPVQAKRLIHASQTLSLYFGLRTAGVDFGVSSSVTDENIFGQ
jgi:pilus assembly protein CpaB